MPQALPKIFFVNAASYGAGAMSEISLGLSHFSFYLGRNRWNAAKKKRVKYILRNNAESAIVFTDYSGPFISNKKYPGFSIKIA